MDEAVWVGAAFTFGLALQAVGLPPLVGFLAAGFALNALGLEASGLLGGIAHTGVLLLLFSVGLKVRLRNVVRSEVWGVGTLHLVLFTCLLAPLIAVGAGVGGKGAWLLALAFGFSSTVVAAKALESKRELRSFHGRIAIGILILQDLAAVALLASAGGHAPSPWAAAVLVLPFLRPLLHRVLEASGHGELLVLYGLLLALTVGGLGFELVGLSPELGALVVGALLADHPRSQELADALWGLKDVLLVGFFLQIGMSGFPTAVDLAIACALVLVVVPLKAAGFFAAFLVFGLRARTAFLAALGLGSFSEFGLIVAQLGERAGWIDPQWLILMALSVAISFTLAAPAYHYAHLLYEKLEPRLLSLERDKRHPDDEPISLGRGNVVVMGMGRVGTGAYDFFVSRGERVVGLDSDPGKIQKHVHAGRRVLYADAEDPGFWQRLKVEGIRAVVLAMPDLEAKRMAATQLRKRGYGGLISATNVHSEEAALILAAGADVTFNYFDGAGVGLAEHTWEAMPPHRVPGLTSGQSAHRGAAVRGQR